MNKWLVVGVLVLLGGGLPLLSLRNGLIDRDEAARSAWAQVESGYQRRFDLTPQLVEVVRTAAANERETQREVVEARTRALESQRTASGALGADGEQAAPLLAEASRALRSFFTVVVEAYPEITATESFVTLQKQIEGSENRIHVARLNYNDAVAELNASVRKWGFLPLCGGVDSRAPFSALTEAEAAPVIDLGRADG